VPAPPPGAIGLDHFEVQVPDAEAVQTVRGRLDEAGMPFEIRDNGLLFRDPSGNALLLTASL